MTVPVTPPDQRFFPILEKYSQGRISAYDAACEIQDLQIPGFDDPSASEVVYWAKMAGFGIPAPTEAEARREADAILKRSGHALAGKRSAATRIYRLAGICAGLVGLSLIVPRFVANPEGGFASGTSAALTFLAMLALALAFSIYLLSVTLREFGNLPVAAKLAGIAPCVMLAVTLFSLLVFLAY